ncbi:alpha/beta hydrolase [Anaerococcus urinomassiliensis]|uniref:alpha/beta hydrolase n=1 Tax=Anaerococcus urinomassiliensis TaxID=1745712 RepID=UPI000938D676|nr:alpha/beta hydrolase [Anaerococcus urinomassiliensis]
MIAKIILIFLIIILIALIIGANHLVNKACLRKYYLNDDPIKINKEENLEAKQEINRNKAKLVELEDYYFDTMRDCSIKSFDNLKLFGKYLINNKSNNWVILVHGYTANAKTMLSLADKYYKNGFSILAHDQRAHGQSEGTYTTFGIKEKEDIKAWMDWIKDINHDAKIIVHGESMGAASTMFLAADNPENLLAFIEDCGYTSFYDMQIDQLKGDLGFLVYPITFIANIIGKIRFSSDFHKSNIDSMKNTKIPGLFIHGQADRLVPVQVCYKVYKNHPGKKSLYTPKLADHAECKFYDQDEYFGKIFEFLEEL